MKNTIRKMFESLEAEILFAFAAFVYLKPEKLIEFFRAFGMEDGRAVEVREGKNTSWELAKSISNDENTGTLETWNYSDLCRNAQKSVRKLANSKAGNNGIVSVSYTGSASISGIKIPKGQENRHPELVALIAARSEARMEVIAEYKASASKLSSLVETAKGSTATHPRYRFVSHFHEAIGRAVLKAFEENLTTLTKGAKTPEEKEHKLCKSILQRSEKVEKEIESQETVSRASGLHVDSASEESETNTVDLSKLKKAELVSLATEKGIKVKSRATKKAIAALLAA